MCEIILEFGKEVIEMYFYEVKVYYPLGDSEKIIMRHEEFCRLLLKKSRSNKND